MKNKKPVLNENNISVNEILEIELKQFELASDRLANAYQQAQVTPEVNLRIINVIDQWSAKINRDPWKYL